MLRNVLVDLALAAFLFTAAGCLISTSNSVNESGVRVGGSTLRQIELGVTTEQWLVAALGQPTSRSAVRGPGNVEFLCYSHERVKQSRGKLFLLFSGSSSKVDRSRTCFEITDGVVTRYWVED